MEKGNEGGEEAEEENKLNRLSWQKGVAQMWLAKMFWLSFLTIAPCRSDSPTLFHYFFDSLQHSHQTQLHFSFFSNMKV